MIGLITYDCPHLKTQEIVERCSNRIDAILLIPFKSRPSRETLFNHRPFQFEGPSPQDLAKSIGAEILNLSDFKETFKSEGDFLVVGGAGILGPQYTSRYQIINAHPGLIPSSRGLDAFKWAIYNKIPPGITIHQINEDIDMGKVIHHEPTKVFASDDIRVLANRHYRNEINTLSSFICRSMEIKQCNKLPILESKMRMSTEKEAEMVRRFEDYKSYFSNINNSLDCS